MSSLLKSALLTATVTEESKINVTSEDIQETGGLDWAKHFFQPEIGSAYLIKFLPCLVNKQKSEQPFYIQSEYSIPDPQRKGKTFRYISSQNPNECKCLKAFFKLNDEKKKGSELAAMKIAAKFLKKTDNTCAIIQILNSPKQEEIGNIRIWKWSASEKQIINSLIKSLIDPSEEDKKASGAVKEDIFNFLTSPVLSLKCVEDAFPDPNDASKINKGRGYTGSTWLNNPKTGMIYKGAIVAKEDGKFHEFSPKDLGEDGEFKDEIAPLADKFFAQLTHEDVCMKTWCMHKSLDDKTLKESEIEYLKKVHEKLDEILPVIINAKSIEEIKNYGVEDTSTQSIEGDKPKKQDSAKQVLADALPDELKQVSISNNHATETQKAVEQKSVAQSTTNLANILADEE